MSQVAIRAVAVGGIVMALLHGVHAVAFRAVPGFTDGTTSTFPPITFPAEAPLHFVAWTLGGLGAWVLVVAILPAIWMVLGHGRLASVVAGLLFVGGLSVFIASGAAMNYYALSAAYAGADGATRAGLAEAFDAVRRTVQTLLGAGLPMLFLGALGMAVASAVARGPAPGLYGALFLVALLLDVPIPVGPPILWGLLNVAAWGAFVLVTVSALRPRQESTLAAAALHP
jgi:hypothetical protein